MTDSNGRRRILHTADLHLASYGDKACDSLAALVDLAIKLKVDLAFIVGDFFDHNRVDQDVVNFAIKQLARLPVDTIILPGNHDCFVPESVYLRKEFASLWSSLPHVRIVKAPEGETVVFPELGISVWGKPIVSYDADMRPMANIPKPEANGQWHIALAHGYYNGVDGDDYRQFPITLEEIIASRQDYVALGHWPTFRCVCNEPVKAYYCDSPSMAGTVNIVDLSRGSGVEVTRQPLLQSGVGDKE